MCSTRNSDERTNESENRFSLLAWQKFLDHKEFKNSAGTCEPCATQVSFQILENTWCTTAAEFSS